MTSSDFPPELEGLAPTDDEPARVSASGVPYPLWSWRTAQLEPGSPSAAAAGLIEEWVVKERPPVLGVVLHGGAGLGKTGMACAAVRAAAARRVGSNAAWISVTAPRVVEAVRVGDFRRRPAPAQFFRWRDLKALLDAAKMGRLPWEEAPPLTADKILTEIEERCAVVALDDVDVDVLTPWKEEVLLRLLELPLRGCRLILTGNADPAASAGLARLGERVCDRLLDSAVFARFFLTGESLRRRRPA